ncbi:MAG TPA: hypothetical protein VL595_14980 [Pseudonocardia sp.]|jgi:hypothetical protein|nr:hypothetical protein [Pseudonocardia sp.]
MMTQPAAQPDQQPGTQPSRQACQVYELRVRGLLEQRWSSWFDGLEIVPEPPENSVLIGPVPDQPALHGLLAKVRDLGLPLISVRLIEDRGRAD